MGRVVRRISKVAFLIVVAGSVGGSAWALAPAKATPTTVDSGLLEVSDLDPGYSETDRAAPDIQSVANPTSGLCAGPNNSERALELDPSASIVGVVFATQVGDEAANLNEDAYTFRNAKAAKAFLKKTLRQVNCGGKWESANGPIVLDLTTTRGSNEVIVNELLGVAGQPFDANTAVRIGLNFIRVGNVVIVLNFSRSATFEETTPGPGYPKSAAKKMAKAIK